MGGDFREKVGMGRDGPELDPPWEYKPSYGPERGHLGIYFPARISFHMYLLVTDYRFSPLYYIDRWPSHIIIIINNKYPCSLSGDLIIYLWRSEV